MGVPFDGSSGQWIEGVAVLVRRAERTGPRRAYEQLAGGVPDEQNVAAVLYRESPTAFIEGWCDHLERPPNGVRIVEPGEPMRSAAVDDGAPPTTVVEGVERPDDLEAIARLVDRHLREWSARDGQSVVYLDSLSALLTHVDRPRAGAFIDRLADAFRTWDATGFVCVQGDEPPGFDVRLDATVELGPDGATVVDPPPVAPADADGPALDAVLDLLRVPERRHVLAHLAVSDSASIDELAESLARRDGSRGDGSSARERAAVALYQIHLPKLADADVVDYDADERVVELREVGALEPFLDLALSYEPR